MSGANQLLPIISKSARLRNRSIEHNISIPFLSTIYSMEFGPT
jgi:hypothetical protein